MRFNGKKFIFGCLIIAVFFSIIFFLPTAKRADAKADKESSTSEAADTDTSVKKKILPPGPMDEYNRGTPRTAVEGFFTATQDGDFKAAANYLNLSTVPKELRPSRGPELARQLNVVLERSLVIDPEVLSTDPKGQHRRRPEAQTGDLRPTQDTGENRRYPPAPDLAGGRGNDLEVFPPDGG